MSAVIHGHGGGKWKQVVSLPGASKVTEEKKENSSLCYCGNDDTSRLYSE